MKVLFNKKFLNHNIGSNAEGDYRIKSFLNKYKDTEKNGEEYFTLVHSQRYCDFVKEGCDNNSIIAEVVVTPESYEAACIATGLTIMASEQKNFAVVRPPGHHARFETPAGFCLFNNIAIAAQKLVNDGKRIFILDIDGHHGDGTQSVFYKSNKVLFCSIHQEFTYPWSGNSDEKGEDEGLGYTMNFPLAAGSGDKEFLFAVDTAIKKATDFNPDIVGISAGFDGYEKDSLLNLNYTLDGYYQCANKLGSSFKNIFAVLEGGYHKDIEKCVESTIAGITN